MITIRKASIEDIPAIMPHLRNKGLDYATCAHMKLDAMANFLFLAEDEHGNLLGQCSLVPESNFDYMAIKRLVIYNKKSCGKGIAGQFIHFFCGLGISRLGCTPWTDNLPMKHLLEKNGFAYQYTFFENYEFYLKSS